MYPFLTAAAAVAIDAPVRVILASALSLGASFGVYPLLKRVVARLRPCEEDCSLAGDAPPPLDRYSWPSGHTMSAAAFGVPVAVAVPAMLPVVILFCVAMAWSRVALGHHYVSDVCAGATLGALMAATVSAAVL